MSNVKIYALGGLDEYGKNLTCVEIDNQIFVINCGIKRPQDSQYGIDYVIPDFGYLVENKDKLTAIIITHIHDDLVEALPFLLRLVNVPVYATKLCGQYIRSMLKENEVSDYRLFEIPRFGEVKIGGRKVTTFGLTHATPDAIGVSIDSPDGQIVIAQQFVIDYDSTDSLFNCDIGAIADIGRKGVLCALIEASYAENKGYTSPKHRINSLIRPYFEDSQGRIIITVYGQNYLRIKEIVDLSNEFNKKIFFYDFNKDSYLSSLSALGIFNIPKRNVITDEKFLNSTDNCVIVVSGFGSRIFNGMHKIAIGEDEIIELRESDTVIIASPIVSGVEKQASAMENELYREGVRVVKLDSKEVLSMHPSSEDIKMMLYLLKPGYFLPVMGSYRNFVMAANLSLETGYTPDRVIILDKGQIASFNNGKLVSCSEVIENIGETLINDQTKKGVTSFVLKDRELLSTDGVIIIGIAVSFASKKVIGGPDIQSRGVIYVKDSEHVIKNVGKMVVDIIERNVAEGTYNNMEVRAEIRESVSHYVFRETGKRPMILPAIIEINI